MLELYHAPLSTCSQKVRIVLAEKGVEWSGHELNLAAGDQNQSAFLKLNPNGVVPVIVHDSRTIIESSLINEYLDEVFPAPALKPNDAADRAAMRLWPKFTDESAQPAIGVITRATMYRAGQMQRPREQVLAAIDNDPKLALRALRRRLYELGPEAPEFAGAVATMIALLDRMESALANTRGLPALTSRSPTRPRCRTWSDSTIWPRSICGPLANAPISQCGMSGSARGRASSAPWRTLRRRRWSIRSAKSGLRCALDLNDYLALRTLAAFSST